MEDGADGHRAASLEVEKEAIRLPITEEDLLCRIEPTTWRFQWLSPRWSALLEYSSSDLLAHSVPELAHRDDLLTIQTAKARMEEGAASVQFQIRYIKKDGSSLHLSWSVRRESANSLLALVQDTTLSSETRLESDERARMLNLAEEMAGVGTWRYDLINQKSYWSPMVYRIHGLPSSEEPPDIDGMIENFLPEEQPIIQEIFIRAVSEGGNFQFEGTLVPPGQRSKRVEVKGQVQTDAVGPTAIIAVFRDVSEMRRREKSLRDARLQAIEANRIKSQFLANMSHEIRTPMNGVLGMAELLADTELSDEQRDYLSHIQSSGANLVAIINDILDLSKIEAGHMNLETARLSVEKIVADVGLSLAAIAHQKDLELIVHVSPELPRTHLGDSVRLRQILVNLLGNAIKFTKSGEVEISASPEAGQVKLMVRDTGVGIAEKRLESVFEAFTQADLSTTREFGGTGLGLTIVRSLVTAMGGTIDLTSELGAGSTFTVLLPLEVVDAESNYCPAERPQNVALLVERNRTRDVLEEQLRAMGHRVTLVDPTQLSRLTGCTLIADARLLANTSRLDPSLRVISLIHLGEQKTTTGTVLRKPLLRETIQRALEGVSASIEDARQLVHKSLPPPQLGLQILLAEDNPVNTKVARLILRKLGHQVTHAENGAAAIQAWQEAHFDLILMDVHMPEVDGFQATRQIRELEGESDSPIPIIALTANAMKGDEERCLNAGMDAYLSKPLNIHKLRQLLERLADDNLS